MKISIAAGQAETGQQPREPGTARDKPKLVQRWEKRWQGFVAVENLGSYIGYAIMLVAGGLLVQQILTYVNYFRAGNQVENVITAVRSLYAGQAGFAGLDNTAMRAMNGIPPDLIDPNNATGILGIFGAVVINVDPADSAQFQIQLSGVSASVCSRLVRSRSGGAQYAGLMGVSINGGAQITTFPVTATQAGAGCNVATAAGNTIQWTYR